MQTTLNTIFFLSLAVGIYFFVDGANQSHHDKDNQLSQTFRNVALLRGDKEPTEGLATNEEKIVNVVRGSVEAARSEIVKVQNVERETREALYIKSAMDVLYKHAFESNQELLEAKQLEFVEAVNEDPELLRVTLETMKAWLVDQETVNYEKEYEIFKLMSLFPKQKTIRTLKAALDTREESGKDGIDIMINHQIYAKIAQLSDSDNDQSDYLISQGDPALLGLVQYSNDLAQSSDSDSGEIQKKINDHMRETFYSEIENAGDERRRFWLEAFSLSSDPEFRKIHLDATNEGL